MKRGRREQHHLKWSEWGDFLREVKLLERGDLRFDMSQSSFEGGPPGRIGRSLGQNVFALQVERLFLSLSCSALLIGSASNLFIHRSLLSGAGIPCSCHLLLHRFAFPTSCHEFIL